MLGAERFRAMLDRDVRDRQVMVIPLAVIRRIAQPTEGKIAGRIIAAEVCFAGVDDVQAIIGFAEPKLLVAGMVEDMQVALPGTAGPLREGRYVALIQRVALD